MRRVIDPCPKAISPTVRPATRVEQQPQLQASEPALPDVLRQRSALPEQFDESGSPTSRVPPPGCLPRATVRRAAHHCALDAREVEGRDCSGAANVPPKRLQAGHQDVQHPVITASARPRVVVDVLRSVRIMPSRCPHLRGRIPPWRPLVSCSSLRRRSLRQPANDLLEIFIEQQLVRRVVEAKSPADSTASRLSWRHHAMAAAWMPRSNRRTNARWLGVRMTLLRSRSDDRHIEARQRVLADANSAACCMPCPRHRIRNRAARRLPRSCPSSRQAAVRVARHRC